MSFEERYQAGNSLLHRLDPRLKVVVAFLLLVGILIMPERAWPAYPLLWALISSLVVAGEQSVWRLARLGGLALPFALAAATLPFTMPGQRMSVLGALTISLPGLIRFVAILLKSWLSVQVVFLLSMTTHFTELLWALGRLRVPQTLVDIIGFMYRYLYLLREEAERLLRARAARSATLPGRKSGGTLLWRAQVAGNMIGSLFLRSYERSERIYAAMLSRGYTGQMRVFDPPALSRKSLVYAAFPLIALMVIELLAVLLWSR